MIYNCHSEKAESNNQQLLKCTTMKMIKINFVSALFLASSLCFVSCSNSKSDADDSKEVAEDQNEEKFDDTKLEDDSEFAVNVADAGMLEVQLGQLAQGNGTSSAVKKFGQEMITAHKKAGEELKALALQKSISLPATLSDKSQKKYDNLAQKTGKDFDDAYSDAMVSGHKDVVDAFKKEIDKGKDEELKSWATSTLPTVEHHLEMAKEVETAVDKMN
jgi:putative membrane protein